MSADSSVLLRSRAIFLTGKGGTGKTTIAAAIGRLVAAQGRRTLVAELDNQRSSLTSIFGVTPGYVPQEVSPRLSVCNIEWNGAMDDFLSDIVSIPRVVRMITHNRVVSIFLDATPGARDLVLLWRVYRLTQQYDCVVVDLPASGNAVAMLAVPNTARRLFDAGPIRTCADELLAFYPKEGVGVVQVALPEEMVVTETIETFRKLQSELPMLRILQVILNRATNPSLEAEERAMLEQLALDTAGTGGAAQELVEAGRWEAGLEEATAEARERLAGLNTALLSVPVLSRGDGPARVVEQTGAALARQSAAPLVWRA